MSDPGDPPQQEGSDQPDPTGTADEIDGVGEVDAPELVPLLEPAEGIPEVVVDERRLVEAGRVLAAGHGPVAVDAERASGHRYGQRAYLVQLRREGSGSWLVDPVACPDLSPIAEAIGDVEWVLHAATQDLPCLAELGLRPSALFDTELGARLAGLPRVGLGATVEHYLGRSLAKEHSAVDWSTRPLPEPWLRYAALDVEVLVQLRDATAADLEAQGKTEWARQEFDALTRFTGPPQRTDPWRRTSGLHRLRRRRALAAARELWLARDRLAQRRDTAPGRVLPDAVIVELAARAPATAVEIEQTRELRPARRNARVWLDALRRAAALPDSQLPPTTVPGTGPPPQRAWADREPVAAARLTQVRAELALFALEHHVPVENLLTPDLLRRVLWTPPADLSQDGIAAALTALGARPWQVQIAAPIIARACEDNPA